MRVIATCLAGMLLLSGVGCARRRTNQARHDVAEIRLALDLFLAEHGAYPEGTTAEICALLLGRDVRGQNPKQLGYIDAQANELNASGEFVDPWGTPYRIIIHSAPRVYSCGPNKIDEGGAGDDVAN